MSKAYEAKQDAGTGNWLVLDPNGTDLRFGVLTEEEAKARAAEFNALHAQGDANHTSEDGGSADIDMLRGWREPE